MTQEELFKWMQEHKGMFLEYDSYEDWYNSNLQGNEKTLEEAYQEWKSKLTPKELEDYNLMFNESTN